MALLTEAAFLAALSACAAAHPVVQTVPPSDAQRVAAQESGLDPLAIGVNADPARGLPAASYRPASVEEAKAIVRRALAAGRRVDAGVMQVTDSNWRSYGLNLDTIFDPAANICAGARILGAAFEVELRRVRRAAFCRYNTGRPDCGNGYPEKVMARAAAAPPAPAVAAPPPAEPLPFDLFERARVLRERAARDAAAAQEATATAEPGLVSASLP